MKDYAIRRATAVDTKAISELTRKNRRVMLFRSPAKLKSLISNYFVAESPDGSIIGCCGAKIYPGGDAEIISLAVKKGHREKGIGDALLKYVLRAALKKKTVKRVLALTTPEVAKFFHRNGFIGAGIQLFHEKILEDCRKCPRNKLGKSGKYLCNEIALIYSRKKSPHA